MTYGFISPLFFVLFLTILPFVEKTFGKSWEKAILKGYTECKQDGSSETPCNVCVPDVKIYFDAIGQNGIAPNPSIRRGILRQQGDLSGFYLSPKNRVNSLDHLQGIQRFDFTDLPYLFVSQNRTGSEKARLLLVEMASRKGNSGRLRSNRINALKTTDGLDVKEETSPPVKDRVVNTVLLSSKYDHAGGMQLIGNILAVPLEKTGNGSKDSRVIFLNTLDLIQEKDGDLNIDLIRNLKGDAGTVSIAKLSQQGPSPEQYLLIVGGNDAKPLDFYMSNTADLGPRTAWTPIYSWHFHRHGVYYEIQQRKNNEWNQTTWFTKNEAVYSKYQNLNLVTQCDGTLYLVGTRSEEKNRMDLFRLQIAIQGDIDQGGSVTGVALIKVGTKEMHCDYRKMVNCNFSAAAGIYISPSGTLNLYATKHDPSLDKSGNWIKFEEFRTIHPYSQCDDPSQAWAEFYDGKNFKGDRGMIFDWVDRALENYGDLERTEAFNDKASSVRWCIPQGMNLTLYKDKSQQQPGCSLKGTGKIEQIPDLDQIPINLCEGDDLSRFADDLSSLSWSP